MASHSGSVVRRPLTTLGDAKAGEFSSCFKIYLPAAPREEPLSAVIFPSILVSHFKSLFLFSAYNSHAVESDFMPQTSPLLTFQYRDFWTFFYAYIIYIVIMGTYILFLRLYSYYTHTHTSLT